MYPCLFLPPFFWFFFGFTQIHASQIKMKNPHTPPSTRAMDGPLDPPCWSSSNRVDPRRLSSSALLVHTITHIIRCCCFCCCLPCLCCRFSSQNCQTPSFTQTPYPMAVPPQGYGRPTTPVVVAARTTRHQPRRLPSTLHAASPRIVAHGRSSSEITTLITYATFASILACTALARALTGSGTWRHTYWSESCDQEPPSLSTMKYVTTP